MYPAAPHRTFIQTVDSSQTFETWMLRNQPKIINKKTKNWDKKANRTTIFSWRLPSKTVLFKLKTFFDKSSSLCAQLLKNESPKAENSLNFFERINYVDNDNTFHNKRILFLNGALPSYQVICLALRTVEFGLVSEKITRVNPNFFICFMLTQSRLSGQRWSAEFSTSLSFELKKILQLSVPFSRISSFTSLRRMMASSLKSKPPLHHTRPCKFNAHQNECFVGLCFSAGRNEQPRTLLATKTPKYFEAIISARSTCSVFHNILLQNQESWKSKAEILLHESKKIVQSHDQANMSLVLVQSSESSLYLCHYVPTLLQQHHVVLRVVQIL